MADFFFFCWVYMLNVFFHLTLSSRWLLYVSVTCHLSQPYLGVMNALYMFVAITLLMHCLVGLVVKAHASRVADQGFDSACAVGIFPGESYQ